MRYGNSLAKAETATVTNRKEEKTAFHKQNFASQR